MPNPYNIATHSILPLTYRILGPSNHITFLLKQPQTNSLFLFNPLTKLNHAQTTSQTESKYHQWLISHIKKIQRQSQSRLTHIFTNHGAMSLQYTNFLSKLKANPEYNTLKLTIPSSTPSTPQIKPQVIGQLSICYINASGYLHDYNLIGVTHISQTSTKIPVLFVNDLFGVWVCSSIDYQHQIKYYLKENCDKGYVKSLNVAKYFPNQTYIFPSTTVQLIDLMFSKALLSSLSNSSKTLSLLSQKIMMYQKNRQKNVDCLLPTTLLEEKLMNPFLNCQKYYEILGLKSKDREKCFTLLKSMRREWKNTQNQ